MNKGKKVLCLVLVFLTALSSAFASDLRGTGYGASREEARANAVQDIKSQIIVEQESTVEIRSTEKNGRTTDSFDVLIREYSRELPLEKITYTDTEDPTADFGMNWKSEAVLSSSEAPYYRDKLVSLASEITEINSRIVNDTSTVKNSTWTKGLLDLCYDFLNYKYVVSALDSSLSVPDMPVSVHRIKLEYEDLMNREKNELSMQISSMTLRLANGDLSEDDMVLLEKYQSMYVTASKNIDELAGNLRDVTEYKQMEFDSSEPRTASDYLIRIEANRKAFDYYRNSPIVMDQKLRPLAEGAIDDLNMISKTTFNTSSEDDDLSFEVLKYSKPNGGWIARATLRFGEKTLQFAFLIPFESFTGTEYNDLTFERVDRALKRDPENYIRLDIAYSVQGEFIGNSYEFMLRGLTVHKITDPVTGESVQIYKAANKNPLTITFDYGTAVDLGDVGLGSDASAIRAKANKKTKSASKLKFYTMIGAGGRIGIPMVGSEDPVYSVGGNASIELGIMKSNDKKGRNLGYYGGGVSASFTFIDGILEPGYGLETAGMPIEIGASGFYQGAVDGTMDNYVRYFGNLGVGLATAESDLYFQFGGGAYYIHMFGDSFSLYAGGSLRFAFREFFDLALAPSFGMNFQF